MKVGTEVQGGRRNSETDCSTPTIPGTRYVQTISYQEFGVEQSVPDSAHQ